MSHRQRRQTNLGAGRFDPGRGSAMAPVSLTSLFTAPTGKCIASDLRARIAGDVFHVTRSDRRPVDDATAITGKATPYAIAPR
jgi:hypothetical protein